MQDQNTVTYLQIAQLSDPLHAQRPDTVAVVVEVYVQCSHDARTNTFRIHKHRSMLHAGGQECVEYFSTIGVLLDVDVYVYIFDKSNDDNCHTDGYDELNDFNNKQFTFDN